MVNWGEVQKIILPIKSYEDVCQRLRISFDYAFIREAYNFPIPMLNIYTHHLLKGDPRRRYEIYASQLLNTIESFHRAGLKDVLELKERSASRDYFEALTNQVKVSASEIAALLKYLVYWVIPSEKYISGLVRDNPSILEALLVMREVGIRTNLQLLQSAITPADRKILADKTRLAPQIVIELVNRSDFSRLPWASKATISNIIGAGYDSLAKLAGADPDKLYADFFRYGKSIGKNLKLGNEIENSYRIAKIIPKVLKDD